MAQKRRGSLVNSTSQPHPLSAPRPTLPLLPLHPPFFPIHLPARTANPTFLLPAFNNRLRRRYFRIGKALPQPKAKSHLPLQAMVHLRPQLRPQSPSIHRHPHPASRRLGSISWLHLQLQQQHRAHIANGAQAVRQLRPSARVFGGRGYA